MILRVLVVVRTHHIVAGNLGHNRGCGYGSDKRVTMNNGALLFMCMKRIAVHQDTVGLKAGVGNRLSNRYAQRSGHTHMIYIMRRNMRHTDTERNLGNLLGKRLAPSRRKLLGVVEAPDTGFGWKSDGGNRKGSRNSAAPNFIHADHEPISPVLNSQAVHLVNACSLCELFIAALAGAVASLLHLRTRVVGKSVEKNVDLVERSAAEFGSDLRRRMRTVHICHDVSQEKRPPHMERP